MGLIEINYNEHRSTHFYADKLAVTEKRLNAMIWKMEGKKCYDVMTDRITAEADVLLRGTRLAIKDIAFELGFKDQSNFSMRRFICLSYTKTANE